eukprot:c17502_g1_i3.p2 GENE.c17502_g1_i3~~c17502_g1_i3.p2  ORF type:complete len:221 (+),score=58.79 c17502_g1_i3:915-1577(+)
MGDWEDRKAALLSQFGTLYRASEQVQKSEKLKELLSIVLLVGNSLNAGTGKGNAKGFKIQSLCKLKDTRAFGANITLLEFLAELVRTNHAQLENVGAELTDVNPAGRVSLSQMELDLGVLVKGLELVSGEIQYTTETQGAPETIQSLTNLLAKLEPECRDLEVKHKEALEAFKSTVQYFGEEPKTQPDALFSIFEVFLADWAKAHKKLAKKVHKSKKDKS